MKRKRAAANYVMRATAEAHLAPALKGHLLVFTGGSDARGSRSHAAAYTIPAPRLDLRGRLTNFGFSTTAGLAAITEALRALAQFSPGAAAMSSYFRSPI